VTNTKARGLSEWTVPGDCSPGMAGVCVLSFTKVEQFGRGTPFAVELLNIGFWRINMSIDRAQRSRQVTCHILSLRSLRGSRQSL
jgi:hypothetical protein